MAVKSVGCIADAEAAAEAANKLWEEVYGREFQGKMVVSYNSQNVCWKVEGTLSMHALLNFGHVPAAQILEDTTVVDCWLAQF